MSTKYATNKDIDFIITGISEICKLEKEKIENKRILSKKISNAIRNKEIIVEIKDKLPLGFIWVTFTKKVPFGINYGNEKRLFCWVNWTYVIKSERNKGIAHSLYEQIEKECNKRNVKEIRGDIFKVNKSSEKFHLKLGYRPQLTIYRKRINE